MSNALAKIWAGRIHAGAHTIEDVMAKCGEEGVTAVRQAYLDLYGEEL